MAPAKIPSGPTAICLAAAPVKGARVVLVGVCVTVFEPTGSDVGRRFELGKTGAKHMKINDNGEHTLTREGNGGCHGY